MAKHSPTRSRRDIIDEHLQGRIVANSFIVTGGHFLVSHMTGSLTEAQRMIEYMEEAPSVTHYQTQLTHA